MNCEDSDTTAASEKQEKLQFLDEKSQENNQNFYLLRNFVTNISNWE